MKRMLMVGTVLFALFAFSGPTQAAVRTANDATYGHVQKGEKHKKAKHHKKTTKTLPGPKR